MRNQPHRLNISQLSERSGISFSQIDLLIQDGIVSLPIEGYMFTTKHEAELRSIKKLKDYGCNIECTKRSEYLVDRFTIDLEVLGQKMNKALPLFAPIISGQVFYPSFTSRALHLVYRERTLPYEYCCYVCTKEVRQSHEG